MTPNNWLHPYRMLHHWRHGPQPPQGVQIIKSTGEHIDITPIFTGYNHGYAEWEVPHNFEPWNGDRFTAAVLPGLTTIAFTGIRQPGTPQ